MVKESEKFILDTIKGVVISAIISLVGILVFALIIKLTGLSSSVIKAVNQFIKVISMFLGCFFSITENKGLIKGIVLGVSYTVIIYLLFLIMGVNAFSVSFIIELIVMGILGGIFGIIIVNMRSKRK